MGVEQPPGGKEPGDAGATAGTRLQILSTEHWSLLATRSLSYMESFSRVSMFFSVLSGAVISLALIAQAGRFGVTFLIEAILVLSIVLFVGVATIARLMDINREDLRWVVGMNRLRHAYLELHPELEQFFTTGWHDDVRGIHETMGMEGLMPEGSRLANAVHGFQTLPAMLSVIVAVVAGTLAALVAAALAASQIVTAAAGVIAFLLTLAARILYLYRSISRYFKGLTERFPSAQS
ncbi:MAG: hypothetical protein M3Y62_03790 [Candidatus Dormibacteraeota bacterium]|nr:hypothetical protein [Candidatus Dormibacteraeota bacterium]